MVWVNGVASVSAGLYELATVWVTLILYVVSAASWATGVL